MDSSVRVAESFRHMWIKSESQVEPHHDKTNKIACAPSEDSDQPGHPPSLIRVFAIRLKKARVLSYPLSAQRRLWSDWADAQADLSLHWAHLPFRWFCHDAVQFTGHLRHTKILRCCHNQNKTEHTEVYSSKHSGDFSKGCEVILILDGEHRFTLPIRQMLLLDGKSISPTRIKLTCILTKQKLRVATLSITLTHNCPLDFSISINTTSPFSNLGVSGLLPHFYFISNRNSCKQTV